MSDHAGDEAVITTEQGVVLTGTHAEAFEARIMASLRKPFYMIFGLLGALFILMLGGALFLSNLDDSVSKSETILVQATSPEAAEAQKLVVQQLLDGMDCKDQLNLQRLVDRLSDVGMTALANVTVVEPACQPSSTTTSTP